MCFLVLGFLSQCFLADTNFFQCKDFWINGFFQVFKGKKSKMSDFCRGIKCNEIEVNPVLKENLLISLKFGLHESSATKYKRGKTATLEKYIREWIGLLERKEMQWLTVIVFDEAGFEAFQFVAGDDCLCLHINIALKSARNWKGKAHDY